MTGSSVSLRSLVRRLLPVAIAFATLVTLALPASASGEAKGCCSRMTTPSPRGCCCPVPAPCRTQRAPSSESTPAATGSSVEKTTRRVSPQVGTDLARLLTPALRSPRFEAPPSPWERGHAPPPAPDLPSLQLFRI